MVFISKIHILPLYPKLLLIVSSSPAFSTQFSTEPHFGHLPEFFILVFSPLKFFFLYNSDTDPYRQK